MTTAIRRQLFADAGDQAGGAACISPGQINGTSGYEEAGRPGAGRRCTNAALKVAGQGATRARACRRPTSA